MPPQQEWHASALLSGGMFAVSLRQADITKAKLPWRPCHEIPESGLPPNGQALHSPVPLPFYGVLEKVVALLFGDRYSDAFHNRHHVLPNEPLHRIVVAVLQ